MIPTDAFGLARVLPDGTNVINFDDAIGYGGFMISQISLTSRVNSKSREEAESQSAQKMTAFARLLTSEKSEPRKVESRPQQASRVDNPIKSASDNDHVANDALQIFQPNKPNQLLGISSLKMVSGGIYPTASSNVYATNGLHMNISDFYRSLGWHGFDMQPFGPIA